MIKVTTLQVLQEVASSITDASNREQVVLCIRWVNANFEVHENFIGFSWWMQLMLIRLLQ